MMNAGRFRAAGAVAVALALAGCQGFGGGPSARGPAFTPPAPRAGVDGEWLNVSDGVSMSRFANGQVETVALDTGNTLAHGTYTMTDQFNVSISMTSLIQQRLVQFNCLIVSPTRLNCTRPDGQGIVLVRREAVS